MKKLLLCISTIILGTALHAQVTDKKLVNTFRERIKLAGYLQAGYTYDDAAQADNSFDVKRLIFIADGQITDRWSAHFIYNLYSGGNMLELYTNYRILPGLGVRFGQFKLPLTMEGPMSPSSVELIDVYSQATNYFTSMSSAHDGLHGSTAGRDIGLMLYGDLFNNLLTYHLGAINGQGINTKDFNSGKDFIASLMFKPLSWLSLGGSLQNGRAIAVGTSAANPDIAVGDSYRRSRWAVGALINTAPLSFRTEFMGGKDGRVNSNGCYALASYHVLPKVDIIASYDFLSKNEALQMEQTNYVAGVQYWFYPRCRLQLQYTYKDNELTGTSNVVQAQVQVRF